MIGDLDQQIQVSFQATSLILVFVTVLFGVRYDQIRKDLAKEIPPGPLERRQHRQDLTKSLVLSCGALLLVNGGVSYLFLPLVVRIFQHSRFDAWNFDFARTAFLLIALLVFFFFVWSVHLAAQLVRRIGECR